MLLSSKCLHAERGLGSLQRQEPEAAGPPITCCFINLSGVDGKGWGAVADAPLPVTNSVLQALLDFQVNTEPAAVPAAFPWWFGPGPAEPPLEREGSALPRLCRVCDMSV